MVSILEGFHCITKNNLSSEAICCCLKTRNVIASEVMVADEYIPCLTVINTTINQLESKVSLISTYCLRLFVVYKHIMLHAQGQ